ncbi:MAG: dienelactone hydrolase family protein [Verrucomicrobia bacterium]|nr:dienelactone hydrolase family protein [Verrucomicrobiota bacterium]MBS0647463.1 dienelactone hydrolase family protein [Verrucomicrobiota bacterium]
MGTKTTQEITITFEGVQLTGVLSLPEQPRGLVLFAHGSGSSHTSPRNQFVASFLQDGNLGTLLFDLLTVSEEKQDMMTRELRFNIPFLAHRLMGATDWIERQTQLKGLPIGYFGASTGAAAAIVAAAEQPQKTRAIVCRGGRPDLAGQSLVRLKTPTLLIVGGADYGVIELNEKAFSVMQCTKKFEIVPDATHLFEEPGALERVGTMAKLWFQEFL